MVETAETAKAIKTARAGKNGKDSKGGEYPKNFVQILCIQYPITFQKKSGLIFLDLGSEVNTIYPTFA